MCAVSTEASAVLTEGIGSLGMGVTGSYTLHKVAGKQLWIFSKSSKCYYPFIPLSITVKSFYICGIRN